jgi:endonuclease YncB( thermonuclease family)
LLPYIFIGLPTVFIFCVLIKKLNHSYGRGLVREILQDAETGRAHQGVKGDAAGTEAPRAKSLTSDPPGFFVKLGVILFTLGIVIFFLRPWTWNSPSPDITGPVVRVFDGDTIEIQGRDRRPVQVRLYGIDAPEKGQPYGDNARQLMSELAYGKDARVFVKDYDKKYGRVVGEV